jgi:hypothetical protein
MNKMDRNTFLKQSMKASAFLLVNPVPSFLFAQNAKARFAPKENLLERLVAANDRQVEKVLQSDFDNRVFGRRIGADLALLAASYSSPTSRYFESNAVVQPLQKLAQHLLQAQAPDGTANFGNLESPPDTAFLLETVTAAAFLLAKEKSGALNDIKNSIKEFLLKAGEALVVGGVHTPNHRWVVSAALARLNALYPSKKYIDRINEWLGEGVFMNADGNYPERSRIYSMVENNALLTIGRLLNKPSLFEPVRKNLEATYYYSEPNGDLVTNDSRRQDQWTFIHPDSNGSPGILNYYLLYRYMAIHDNNNTFAAIAKMIEGLKGFEETILNRSLVSFLEEPRLQNELPAPSTLPVNYEKLFAQSHLLRIRKGDTAATLFGGVDWPLVIASGRSCSPDFFSYRKGGAVLKYLRLSTNFFNTGYFYSQGLKKEGTHFILSKKLDVPYYQPLPKAFRKADGDYALSESIDHRFWNKMDFTHRPVSNVKTLETTVSLTETGGRVELTFDVKGQAGVNVVLELCFAQGGQLAGVAPADNNNYFLEDGTGKYTVGNDFISFGPGIAKHKAISNLEGERYTTHFGSLRTEGLHVYLTGVTPFTHTLTFS